LRWFSGRVEALFGASESCAGVEYMMTLDAWECIGRASVTRAEVEAPTLPGEVWRGSTAIFRVAITIDPIVSPRPVVWRLGSVADRVPPGDRHGTHEEAVVLYAMHERARAERAERALAEVRKAARALLIHAAAEVMATDDTERDRLASLVRMVQTETLAAALATVADPPTT
jgi:hypothetical protein